MHKYLRAIGFAGVKSMTEIVPILEEVVKGADYSQAPEPDKISWVNLQKEIAGNMGISLSGELNPDAEPAFHMSHYVPYYKGSEITVISDCKVSRRAENLSFSMMGEDLRLGFPLIFYLQNGEAFMSLETFTRTDGGKVPVILSGLSTDGEVLLPIHRSVKEKEQALVSAKKRMSLLESAMEGDIEAMESLSLLDTAQYAMAHSRMQEEDLYTLVDTCFMPTGMECDMYTILGDILEAEKVENPLTGEFVWEMLIESNDKLRLNVCINTEDLYGEPAPGRRFKGDIWLQGRAVLDQEEQNGTEQLKGHDDEKAAEDGQDEGLDGVNFPEM